MAWFCKSCLRMTNSAVSYCWSIFCSRVKTLWSRFWKKCSPAALSVSFSALTTDQIALSSDGRTNSKKKNSGEFREGIHKRAFSVTAYQIKTDIIFWECEVGVWMKRLSSHTTSTTCGWSTKTETHKGKIIRDRMTLTNFNRERTLLGHFLSCWSWLQ